jgi:hypothetical protein
MGGGEDEIESGKGYELYECEDFASALEQRGQ